MSLVNRMLQDLALRQPATPDMNSGLQFSIVTEQRSSRREAGLMLALIVVFSTVLWWLFETQQHASLAPLRSAAASAAPALLRFQLEPRLDLERARAVKVALAPAAVAASSELRMVQTLQAPPRARRARAVAPLEAETAPAEPAYHETAALETAAPETVALAPAPPRAGKRDVRAAHRRHEQALAALRNGQRVTAEEQLREALLLDPALHAARETLAGLLLDHGRLAEAQALLQEDAARQSDRTAYRRLGARLDLAQGNADGALARLESSLPALAADPEYHGLLASVYQRLGRHPDAAAVYWNLVQMQPNEAHWWAGYGISRDAQQQSGEALKAYDRARALGALDARVLDYIARRSAALREQG